MDSKNKCSWADFEDDDDNCIIHQYNQWSTPLVIKKELLDEQTHWVVEEKIENKDTTEMDKTIKCRDCKKDFLWTAQEQQWYRTKRFINPKTCKQCNVIRKSIGRIPNHNRKKILAL